MEITVDTVKLVDTARELDTVNRNIATCVDKMTNMINRLQSDWVSPAGSFVINTYYDISNKMSPTMTKTMGTFAQHLRCVSGSTENVENTNKSLADAFE